jgi:hypothetical protein
MAAKIVLERWHGTEKETESFDAEATGANRVLVGFEVTNTGERLGMVF